MTLGLSRFLIFKWKDTDESKGLETIVYLTLKSKITIKGIADEWYLVLTFTWYGGNLVDDHVAGPINRPSPSALGQQITALYDLKRLRSLANFEFRIL